MSNMQFIWESDEDQTYTSEYGSQTLDAPPTGFNKACGKEFHLNAPGQQLTLMTASDNTNSWGGACSGFPTTFFLENGTLQCGESNQVQEDWGQYEILDTDMVLKNAATYRVLGAAYRSGWGYDDTNPANSTGVYGNRIVLNDSSTIEIACTDGYTSCDRIQIRDQSSMTVSGVIVLGLSAVAVSSQPPGGPSNRPSLGYRGIIRASKSTFVCSGPSYTMIQCPPQDPSTNESNLIFGCCDISASGSAKIEIYADNIQFTGPTQFSLDSSSTASVTFSGSKPGTPAFDFINKDYPTGLFYFDESWPSGTAEFVFRACGAFDLRAMLDKQLIWMGDVAATASDIQTIYQDGSLIIRNNH